MKKTVIVFRFMPFWVTTFAQKKEMPDPELNAINRAPARADYFAYPSREMAEQGVREESSNFLSLNGMWEV